MTNNTNMKKLLSLLVTGGSAVLLVISQTGCGSTLKPLSTNQPPLVLSEPQLGRYYLGSDRVLFPQGRYAAKYEEEDAILYESPTALQVLPWFREIKPEQLKALAEARVNGEKLQILTRHGVIKGGDVSRLPNCVQIGTYLVDTNSGVKKRGGIVAPKNRVNVKDLQVWWLDGSLGPNKYIKFNLFDVQLPNEK